MFERKDVPPKYRATYDRAMAGRSRKDAMRLSCLMCQGWDQTGVRDCPSRGCPSHPYRLIGITGAEQTGSDGQLDIEQETGG
jgi:hypothetical protein